MDVQLRRLLSVLLVLCAVTPAIAGFPSLGNHAVSAGGGCSQSSALIARMDGAQNTTAVQNLICGMVTDSTYSIFDALYVFATNSTTNANLNWAQNKYNLTKVGSVTFNANVGYTGDGSTGYFTTGFNPSTSGGNYTLNSASLGGCMVNSRTTNQSYVLAGGSDGTQATFMQARTGGAQNDRINATSSLALSSTNAQGSQIVERTLSTGLILYLNGSNSASGSQNTSSLPNVAFYVLGENNNGTPANFDADQVAYVLFASGLTSGQASNIYSRLHTYLQAVGETTAC